MKNSTLIAIIIALAAAVGALAAAACYLRRREKELDEYEELLFSEDFADEVEEPAEEADDFVAAPIEPADEEL